MSTLHETIRNFILKEYFEDDEEELTMDTPLISGGIVDSFSMVSLKVYLEKTFSIKIPDSKATPMAFDSINRIAALVKEYRQEA